MHICVSVCVYKYMYMLFKYIYICVYIYMHIHVCMYKFIYMYKNISIYVYVKEGFFDSTTDVSPTNFNKNVYFTEITVVASREPEISNRPLERHIRI